MRRLQAAGMPRPSTLHASHATPKPYAAVEFAMTAELSHTHTLTPADVVCYVPQYAMLYLPAAKRYPTHPHSRTLLNNRTRRRWWLSWRGASR